MNDAVLAAVAGGLRELLQSRGEMVDGRVLRAMVPVTLQNPSLGPLRGNLYGVMVVRLPVGEPDAVRRLHSIAAETASRKQRAQRPWGIGVFGSPLMQRLTLPVAGRQHYINIHVANVRGPAGPLYLAGARLTTAFPVVPLNVNLTIGIGVLSYTNQLNITAVADRDRCGPGDVHDRPEPLHGPPDPGRDLGLSRTARRASEPLERKEPPPERHTWP